MSNENSGIDLNYKRELFHFVLLSHFSGKCNDCHSILDNVEFTKDEVAFLCEAVKDRVLLKEDIYQSTMPGEIERFLNYLFFRAHEKSMFLDVTT